MPAQTCDGRRIEQGRAVFKAGAPVAVLAFHQVQRQVELGDLALPVHLRERQARHLERAKRRVLQHHHHLEQRRVALVALQLERLDQLLERHVLIGVGIERGVAHLGKQRFEAGPLVNPRAQGQHVEEEADQRLDLAPVAVGDRGADADVVLARIARQQDIQYGVEHHERRRPRCLRDLLQTCAQHCRNEQLVTCARIVRQRRACTVGRQIEQARCVSKLVHPVCQLPAASLTGQPCALPVRVVRVLHRQFRQRRCSACRQGRIQCHHFVDQYAHRPAVGDDMVQCDENHVLLRRQPDQLDADQRALFQVERRACLVLGQPTGACLALAMRQVGQVRQRHVQRQHRRNELHRGAIDNLKARAQHLVPAHHLVQCRAQGLDIEFARQAQGHGNVIEGFARLDLVEEPQPLLRV